MNPTLGFSLALAAGLIWSVGNIVHKVLASRLVRSTALMVVAFSIVSALIGGAFLFWFPLVPLGVMWYWVVGGAVCYVLAVWAYLSAMRTEEASRIVPLFGIGSVLIVIFSAVLLGEVLGVSQYIGVGCVLFGAVMISYSGSFRSLLSGRLLRYMSISGTAFAGHALVVKYLLDSFSFGSVFASLALIQAAVGGVVVIGLWPHVRSAWQATTLRAVLLNIINNFFGFGAELLYTIALSVWYLSLVETVASLQFIFIFVWGAIVSRWFPHVLRETISRAILIRKLIAIIIIVGGIYLIT